MSEIPEKCMNCRIVKNTQAVIEAHEQQIADYGDRLMSDEVDTEAEQLVEQYPEQVVEIYGVSTPKELAELKRKTGSKQLDFLEAHNNVHREQLAKFVLGCTGVVERQFENDDTKFTVALCASPELPNTDGPTDEVVVVTREKKNS
jgi:hypothetical protein